ncbi:hypothetical protein ACUH7Y_07005 [Clostridium beijerinckii]|uniref:Uncharacterized protein n=1 Tax=Clostridium beijerinckii TaxID=1520 RepID=A0A7X9XQE1_CLOBE|nr:hypothetical protein [Clostridium beijerinckii]NMF06273.1 hypothetical protein [Clostridium beijerinckii]
MRFDMLEVKKDRLVEIDKRIKYCVKNKLWFECGFLDSEKKTLLQEIKDIESKRGVINE